MKYLHTMLRVRNLDAALHFYVDLLGLKEARRRVDEKNKYTLVFLYAPEDEALVKASMEKTGRDQPMLDSPTTGTPRTTARRATSATSPTRSTTSTRPARG